MNEAAQEVQRKIQCVSRKRDNEKENDIPWNGAQRIEHLGDDASGQHQGHQTRIGQNIAEIARHMVVDGTEHGSYFAKALRIPSGTHQNHHDTHIKHELRDSQYGKGSAEKHHPPSYLFPHGIHDLSVFQFFNKTDHHAGNDLHRAEAHGSDQNTHGIIQRGKQGRKTGELSIWIDDFCNLWKKIPEKAARDDAHDKGTDAAKPHQSEEIAHAALWA